jgi:predicted glycosyltransferase
MDLEDLPARAYDLHPAEIHDAMAEAALLVADTGTMATEAALCGTPAIRYRGTDDHEYGEFRALEDAGLAHQVDTYDAVQTRSRALLTDDDATDRYQARRASYVDSLCDLTDLLVSVAESRGQIDRLQTQQAVAPRSSPADPPRPAE